MRDSPAMHPYIGWAGDHTDATVLVFARDSRDAKPIAYCLLMLPPGIEYSDVRVQRLRDRTDWLLSFGNPRHLAAGRAHGLFAVPVRAPAPAEAISA